MLLSVFCYWGFEAAFSVNEEVRAPRQAPRAGITTLVTMLGLFLLGSIAFQRVLRRASWRPQRAEGLAFLGRTGSPTSRWPRCPWSR